MKRALIFLLAAGCGLALAGILMALVVPATRGGTGPLTAVAVIVASVVACLGLAAILRRE